MAIKPFKCRDFHCFWSKKINFPYTTLFNDTYYRDSFKRLNPMNLIKLINTSEFEYSSPSYETIATKEIPKNA